VLDLGGEPSQLCIGAEVLAQATDVFDRNENSMPLGIIELKVLSSGAIVRLQHPGTDVAADAVGGMDNQFARLKWRGELS